MSSMLLAPGLSVHVSGRDGLCRLSDMLLVLRCSGSGGCPNESSGGQSPVPPLLCFTSSPHHGTGKVKAAPCFVYVGCALEPQPGSRMASSRLIALSGLPEDEVMLRPNMKRPETVLRDSLRLRKLAEKPGSLRA